MGGSSKQTVGYRYYMAIHAGVCHGPVDNLLEIRAGNLTAWSGNQTASGQIFINAPNLFGGDKKEGGIQGNLDVMMGEATQNPNSFLQGLVGGISSAYRGLMTVFFEAGLIGSNNPYPKPWSFRVRRITQGWDNNNPWYTAKAAVTLSNGVVAMNPAHIVYEVLTNRDWGMGYPASLIDATNFQAAADQMYSEGMGLCLLWLRQDTIENFLQTIMDYIGGVLVHSPTTGLFQLNLIRGGYNISSLPVFAEANVNDLQALESPAITNATNEIVVEWFDPTTKTKQYTAVQALGAIQAQGVVVSATKQYDGIASQDLAARVAQRELQATSVPLKRIQVKFDRTAYQLVPGGLFVLNFPDLGINSMVFRVGEVNYGTLTDGSILVTAIQDVFSLPSASYIQLQTTGWTVPNTTATPPPYTLGFEASYRDLYIGLGSADLGLLASNAGYAAICAARPSGLSVNYQIWSRVGAAAYVQYGVEDFAPNGSTQSSLNPFDTTVTIQNGIDLASVVTPCAAIIDNEIVLVSALNASTGVATIARGCEDTVPATHAAGALVWFKDHYIGSDEIQYFSGETVNVIPLTVTTKDTLALASGIAVNCVINGRQNAPYPPAFLSINGTRWDQLTELSGQLTLTWRERNRITQADQLIDNTQGTITPETGTSYTLTLQDGTGATFATFTGLTGTSWTWTTPDDTHATMGFTLTTVRGGVSSIQSQKLAPTARVGYGINYGNDYGSA